MRRLRRHTRDYESDRVQYHERIEDLIEVLAKYEQFILEIEESTEK
jgi:hypothetical protein